MWDMLNEFPDLKEDEIEDLTKIEKILVRNSLTGEKVCMRGCMASCPTVAPDCTVLASDGSAKVYQIEYFLRCAIVNLLSSSVRFVKINMRISNEFIIKCVEWHEGAKSRVRKRGTAASIMVVHGDAGHAQRSSSVCFFYRYTQQNGQRIGIAARSRGYIPVLEGISDYMCIDLSEPGTKKLRSVHRFTAPVVHRIVRGIRGQLEMHVVSGEYAHRGIYK